MTVATKSIRDIRVGSIRDVRMLQNKKHAQLSPTCNLKICGASDLGSIRVNNGDKTAAVHAQQNRSTRHRESVNASSQVISSVGVRKQESPHVVIHLLGFLEHHPMGTVILHDLAPVRLGEFRRERRAMEECPLLASIAI